MSDLKITIGAKIDDYLSKLKTMRKQNEALRDELTSIGKGASVAFAGFGGAIALAVRQAAKFEAIETQFEVLTGSVENAKRAVKDLSDFSAGTPFDFPSIAKAGQQLLGFGFSADQLKPRLQEIGDVAAAIGKPIDEVGFIFGQVAAAGKLTGERLLQFQERAIPIGPALAKTMGVAEESIKDLVSQGKIDFESFQKAFQSLSQEGGFAFGGLEKQSKTLNGGLSTLGDNFSLLAADLGREFLPHVKAAVTQLTSFIQVMRDNKDIVKTAAVVLSLGTAIAGVTAGMAFSVLGFLKLKNAISAAQIALQGMTFTLKGFLGATGVGLLLVLLSDLAVNWEVRFKQMRAIFAGFANNVSQLSEGLGATLKGAFTLDTDLISQGITQVKEAFSGAGTEISESFKQIAIDQEMSNQLESAAETRRDHQRQEIEELNQHLITKEEVEKAHQERMTELRAELRELEVEERLTRDQRLEELELEHRTRMLELSNANRDLDKKVEFEIEEEKTKKLIAENRLRLKDEKQYGKELAAAKAFFRSTEYEATGSFLDTLTTLTRSRNRKLFEIGKAASIARAVVNVAEGVTKTLSHYPYPLSTALAGAQFAAGAVQLEAIRSQKFAFGGLVEGGIPGMDSVPAILQSGELVAPRKNFDEVVNAVARDRIQGGDSGPQSSRIEVEIGFRDNAGDFIEATLIERDILGQSQRGA